MGSDCDTARQNFTLPFVYSCPGWINMISARLIRESELLHRPSYHLEARPESHSAPCASPAQCPRRTARILQQQRTQHYSTQFSSQGEQRQGNHTANEKCIPCENSFLLAILHKIANAILRMARRMQRRHGDAVSNLKDLTMRGSLRDGLAVFSANNGHLKGLQNLVVTTCVIPVAVGM